MGVSADPVDRQKAFDEKNRLGFPLLSDPDRKVHKLFGTMDGLASGKRTTFVIDRDRRVLKAIRSETNMLTHADTALEALGSELRCMERAATRPPS